MLENNVENSLLSVKDIKENLADKRLSRVASATGLSYVTIKKIADGRELNYTTATLKLLSDYINNNKT